MRNIVEEVNVGAPLVKNKNKITTTLFKPNGVFGHQTVADYTVYLGAAYESK